jgi:ADP-ribose pyrophosphatase YjhB (NUDIX family)
LTDRPSALAALICQLEEHIDPSVNDLPEELFLFVSRISPLVNVDLLIQDDDGRTLLTWRSDEFYGPGWHVPGGIVRFRETAANRIRAVAHSELGAAIEHDAAPVLVREDITAARRDRAHFVSLLYRCRLASNLDQHRQFDPKRPLPGQWLWHVNCPGNLIHEQLAYAALIG